MKNSFANTEDGKFESSRALFSLTDREKTGVFALLFSLVILILAGVVYYNYGTALMRFIPPCLLYTMTGIQCPICGAQRAVYQLLHGNLIGAVRLNCFALVLIGVGIVVYFKFLYRFYFKNDNRALNLNIKWIIVLSVFAVLFTVIRNIL